MIPENRGELQQGTPVKFDCQPLIGTGKICGIASNGQPYIGRGYIIEPDTQIKSEDYNYSHIVIYELYLTEL